MKLPSVVSFFLVPAMPKTVFIIRIANQGSLGFLPQNANFESQNEAQTQACDRMEVCPRKDYDGFLSA